MRSKSLLNSATKDVPNQVLNGLFIGNYEAAHNRDLLKQHGVTHVLNVGSTHEGSYFPSDFTYLTLNLEDSQKQDILSHIPNSVNFIDLGRNAGGVLVHCYRGKSRSSAIVCAYLMFKHLITFDQALDIVSEVRPFVLPNKGFMKQLEQYEKMLSASGNDIAKHNVADGPNNNNDSLSKLKQERQVLELKLQNLHSSANNNHHHQPNTSSSASSNSSCTTTFNSLRIVPNITNQSNSFDSITNADSPRTDISSSDLISETTSSASDDTHSDDEETANNNITTARSSSSNNRDGSQTPLSTFRRSPSITSEKDLNSARSCPPTPTPRSPANTSKFQSTPAATTKIAIPLTSQPAAQTLPEQSQ